MFTQSARCLLCLHASERLCKIHDDLGIKTAVRPLCSDAKRRMAAVEAGRAVVLSLTPGIPAVQHVTIQPRGGALGRVVFQAMVRCLLSAKLSVAP